MYCVFTLDRRSLEDKDNKKLIVIALQTDDGFKLCKLHIKDRILTHHTLQKSLTSGWNLKCFLMANKLITAFHDSKILLFDTESLEQKKKIEINECL